MTLAEIDRPTRAGRSKDGTLRDWVRALEATAPIAGQPQRLLLDAVEDIAQDQGDAAALISERGTLTYRALAERSRRYARWALDQKLAKGQDGLPADAEPAGLYGDLARHHRGRRRRLAHQHAIARAGSCALHRRRGADPRDRRRRMHRAVPLGATFQPAENLVARRPRLFAHRSRDRAACRQRR